MPKILRKSSTRNSTNFLIKKACISRCIISKFICLNYYHLFPSHWIEKLWGKFISNCYIFKKLGPHCDGSHIASLWWHLTSFESWRHSHVDQSHCIEYFKIHNGGYRSRRVKSQHFLQRGTREMSFFSKSVIIYGNLKLSFFSPLP